MNLQSLSMTPSFLTVPALLALCISAALSFPAPAIAHASASTSRTGAEVRSFNIPAQSLTDALIVFGQQAGLQITASSGLVAGKRVAALNGAMTAQQALHQLLQGSGLGYRLSGAMVSIEAASAASRSDTSGILPSVNIRSTTEQPPYRSGNMDLIRSEDDIQPYVVVSRETIENSGATSVEDLLRQVLPMSTSTENQTAGGWTGTSSQINLRGLGTSHTLILINGRRGAGLGSRGTSEVTDQQNINGIPLAAIERIEILPTSASAIYGSNAIGGVINVVLRRDYTGTEINFRHGNTFDTDQASNTINFTSGFSLEEGRTRLLLTGQQQQSNALLEKDRDFARRGRQNVLQNNPDSIYGMNGRNAIQPPYGTLVNVRSVNGSPLFPEISSASFTHLPHGFAGWQQDGVQPLIDNLGTYSLGLSGGIGSYSGVDNLIGESESTGFGVSIHRDFTDTLNVFADIGYEKSSIESAGNYHGFGVVSVPATAPNNPFGQAVNVAYPANYADGISQQMRMNEIEGKRAAVGFNWQLTPGWIVNADYSYSNARNDLSYQRRPNVGTAAYEAALANGTLDVLRDVTSFTTLIEPYWTVAPNFSDQTLHDYTLRAAVTLLSGYAGDIKLATGLEHRRIDSESRSETGVINNAATPITVRKQHTTSVYAELTVPLIAPAMAIPFAHKLDMQIAGRHERFDITSAVSTFDATTPTLGFSFEPVEQLMIRASYGEGFVTPTVSQIAQPLPAASLTAVTDPLRGNEQVEFYAVGGGNPDIEPESSKSINAGFVLVPIHWIPGLRISVDYFKIRKENNITSLAAQALVNNPELYGDRITRAPVDAADDYPVGRILEVYTGPMNALWLETSGIDTNVTWMLDLALGELTFNLGYTWTDKYQQQNAVGAAPVSYLGDAVSDGPLEQRANASAYLKTGDRWSFGWAMQVYGDYRLVSAAEILNNAGEKVASQVYHDIYARATLPQFSSHLDTTQITVGIKNLFNDSSIAGSSLSRYTDPRLRQYYVNAKVAF